MRILIADDHGIVRGGMKLLIDRQPDMEVVAEAGDGVEAFEQALATKPDLCVMDVSMPRMTGLQAARQIRAHLPETQVLALSMHDDERYVFDALKAGASGYVLKREVDQALLNAIRAVSRGDAFLTNAVERTIVREWMSDSSTAPPANPSVTASTWSDNPPASPRPATTANMSSTAQATQVPTTVAARRP